MRDQTHTFSFLPNDKVKAIQFGVLGVVYMSAIDRDGIEKHLVEWVDSHNNIVNQWFAVNQLEAA